MGSAAVPALAPRVCLWLPRRVPHPCVRARCNAAWGSYWGIDKGEFYTLRGETGVGGLIDYCYVTQVRVGPSRRFFSLY